MIFAFPSMNSRRWPKLVTAVLVCSLMFCLATRFYTDVSSHVQGSKSAQSRSVDPKRQHLDADAVHWVAPVAVAMFLEHVSVYPRIFTADTLPVIHSFDESLYNRPPPQPVA